MANKRNLKRSIHLISEQLFTECIAANLYGPNAHKDNTDALLFSVVQLQEDFIRRVSHPEPGLTAKAYYQRLRSDFSVQVNELVDQIINQ